MISQGEHLGKVYGPPEPYFTYHTRDIYIYNRTSRRLGHRWSGRVPKIPLGPRLTIEDTAAYIDKDTSIYLLLVITIYTGKHILNLRRYSGTDIYIYISTSHSMSIQIMYMQKWDIWNIYTYIYISARRLVDRLQLVYILNWPIHLSPDAPSKTRCTFLIMHVTTPDASI